jgi:hypothetical protein
VKEDNKDLWARKAQKERRVQIRQDHQDHKDLWAHKAHQVQKQKLDRQNFREMLDSDE